MSSLENQITATPIYAYKTEGKMNAKSISKSIIYKVLIESISVP